MQPLEAPAPGKALRASVGITLLAALASPDTGLMHGTLALRRAMCMRQAAPSRDAAAAGTRSSRPA